MKIFKKASKSINVFSLHQFTYLGLITFTSLFFFQIAVLFFFELSLFKPTYNDSLIAVLSYFKGSYLQGQITNYFFREEHYSLIYPHLNTIKVVFLFILFLFITLQITTLIFCFHKENNIPFKLKHKKQYLITLAIFVCLHTLHFTYFPLHVDELFDFIEFSKKPFHIRQAYIFTDNFSWFNNHILYTHLTNLFSNVCNNPKLTIRLTSIITSLTLITYVHFSFDKKTSFKLNLLFLFSFWLFIYSAQGRSYYAYTVVYFIISIELYKYSTDRKNIRLLLIETLSLIGLMFSKTFLIPCIGIMIVTLLIAYTYKTQLALSIFLITKTLISIVIFYSPALLLNGLNSIFITTQHNKNNLITLLPVFFENLSLITSFNSKSYIGILLYGFIILLTYKQLSRVSKYFVFLFIIQLFVFICFIITTQTFLPCRSQLHLHLSFILSTFFMLSDYFKQKKHSTLFINGSIALFIYYNFYLLHYSWVTQLPQYILGRKFYTQIRNITKRIDQYPGKTVYIADKNTFLYYYTSIYTDKKIQNTPINASLIITEKKPLHFDFFYRAQGLYFIVNKNIINLPK